MRTPKRQTHHPALFSKPTTSIIKIDAPPTIQQRGAINLVSGKPRHTDMVKSEFREKPCQIESVERLQKSNQIPYKQAWRAKKEVQKGTFIDANKSSVLHGAIITRML